jgi:hypothetical protein
MERSEERNGVRLGLPVRDLDGRKLGRVTDLYEEGFAVEGGFPILFRRDYVFSYHEARGVQDGSVVVARSERALLDLADGRVPPSWRIPVPPEIPSIATPAEARQLVEALAGERGVPVARASAPEAASETPVSAEEEREYVRSRGEALGTGPATPR